jgi:tetratricopeptide (TPR) repeat protein
VYGSLGQIGECIHLLEKSLIIFREYDDKRKEGGVLSSLGNAYKEYGEYNKAIDFYIEAQRIGVEIDDNYLQAVTSLNSADAFLAIGELEIARDGFTLAVGLFRQIGNEKFAKDAEETLNRIREWGKMNDKQKVLLSIILYFKPLIIGVKAVSNGNIKAKGQVEGFLKSATKDGWNLSKPIQLIIGGERDSSTLTKDLDESDTYVVKTILQQL